ncbi:Putative uncharacterized protein [Moritella viscosa]|uniref:hypothetical protein n=1 Tax=Moritella viscosa TaxID=80854 RepID=UPI0009248F8D|nr:hypothetical protein [Moritella viscosa]SGZ10019.1 Putative uncharacterized protein [Moritella viscosa]
MAYLTPKQEKELTRLLRTFFAIPYSTDLDGKDVESLLKIVKKSKGRISKRKELFDIVDGKYGYSVKTLKKSPQSTRVDLQEQRFCDPIDASSPPEDQGEILLSYMVRRIREQMENRSVEVAKSLILLKHWNEERTSFFFKYWEEDFLGYIEELWSRHNAGEIEWVKQESGLHGRDLNRQDKKGNNVRLIRMHYKHNQIFTDHDIPSDANTIEFESQPLTWEDVVEAISNKIDDL